MKNIYTALKRNELLIMVFTTSALIFAMFLVSQESLLAPILRLIFAVLLVRIIFIFFKQEKEKELKKIEIDVNFFRNLSALSDKEGNIDLEENNNRAKANEHLEKYKEDLINSGFIKAADIK